MKQKTRRENAGRRKRRKDGQNQSICKLELPKKKKKNQFMWKRAGKIK